MSPYTLRKRNSIKPPKRYDDDNCGSSPREAPACEKTSKADKPRNSPEPRWPSPPRTRSTNKGVYRGPVTTFNPNLPPAAFPTLDVPQQSPSIVKREDLDHHQHILLSELPVPHLSNGDSLIAGDGLNITGHGLHQVVNSRSIFSTPARGTSSSTRLRSSASMTANRQTSSTLTHDLGPSDQGPPQSLYERNMKKIGELGRRTDFDWTMAEMETSDEEEDLVTPGTEVIPAWKDLTTTYKLDLADALRELHPEAGAEWIMARLKLGCEEAVHLADLLLKRQKRSREEETSAKQLRDHTQAEMLNGKMISETDYRNILEQTIYRRVGEDHCQSTPVELAKAKAYLKYCGYDPLLLDDTWARPISGSATPRSQFSGSIPDVHATSDVARSSGFSEKDSSSRMPAKYTAVLQSANAVLPQHGQANQTSHGGSLRRRATAAEMIAAHSSPVAAHLVPSREFQATSGKPQDEDMPAGIGQPCPRITHEPRSSLASRPQNTTTGHAQAIRSPLSKVPSPSTLPPPSANGLTLPRSANGPLVEHQGRAEPSSRERTASAAIQPHTTAVHGMSSAGISDSAPRKRKRAPTAKPTAGALKVSTATADGRSVKRFKSDNDDTPAPPTTATPPASYPWASNLEMTSTNNDKVRNGTDRSQKKR